MSRGRLWVLNLDAEHELEAGRGYQPTQRMHELVAAQSRRLRGVLVGPDDAVVTEANVATLDPERIRDLTPTAWSPTPRALALLARAGAPPLDAPSVEVLHRVNERSFAREVRASLAEPGFVKHRAVDLDEALAHLDRPTPNGWLVRRPFGAAGRGRRRIAAGAPSAAERAWLVASLRRGALVIEPWVSVTRELTRSGLVDHDGEVHVLPPCFQTTTREGAWIETRSARRGEVGAEHDARLEEAAARAGEALAAAGYFGPYGIDAFLHRPLDGSASREVLNPLSEINARFTMDWNAAYVHPNAALRDVLGSRG